MSLIVAGRFTTFPAAESAAQALFDHGFLGEDVMLFFVNPRGQHARHAAEAHTRTASSGLAPPPPSQQASTAGAVAGAGIGVAIFMLFGAAMPVVVLAAAVGACIGSIMGRRMVARGEPHEHREVVHREMRDSGVLVAVHVGPENQMDAARILREAGAADIERATGRWQRGRWADFDPLHTPEPLGELNQQQA
jgi:hypothetical protein